jgi:hypothetical protein
VLRWLAAACGEGPETADAVLSRLLAAAPGLAWSRTYDASAFGADFLERYGWTELVGQRGPIPSDRLAAGFLLLGPGTLYPAHRHVAEEIYLPLSGTAEWLRGGEDWRARSPLEVIHHTSDLSHAMRTGAEPLLALYLWRGGDLTETSRVG